MCVCACNEEFALFAISERVVDTSRNLLKCVGGVGAGGVEFVEICGWGERGVSRKII